MKNIERITPLKGTDPDDPNIYCPFPSSNDSLDSCCGRRSHRKCSHGLCKKCCSLIAAVRFQHKCVIHPESASKAKGDAARPRVEYWMRKLSLAEEERQRIPSEDLEDDDKSNNSSRHSSPISSSHSSPRQGNSKGDSAKATSLDVDALALAIVKALGLERGRSVSSQDVSSFQLPPKEKPKHKPPPIINKNISDAFSTPPPVPIAGLKDVWSLQEARDLLSYAVYSMGDSATVQVLRKELDQFIRMREAIPGEDTTGALATQQAKCNDAIYQRMGYKAGWAASEKAFLENFVDIPTHMGKPYAYLTKPAKTPSSYKDLAALSVAEGTFASYQSALRVYNAFCGQESLNPADEQSMQKYILHCFNAGDSNGRALAAYSALCLWAKLENKPLNFSPLTLMGLRAFKRLYKRQRAVVWVTLPNLHALLQHWSELQLPFWVLLVLSFFTLVRPVEILHLKWGHVFIPEKYIYLPWSKNDPEGEGTYVTLLPPALDAITRLHDSLPRPPARSQLVFDIPKDHLNSWLKVQCEKAGVGPFTWYHLKHGGATHFALQGWSFAKIKAHGRWKSDQAARVYIHAPTHQ